MSPGFTHRQRARSPRRITPAKWDAAVAEALWLAGRAVLVEEGAPAEFADRLSRFRARVADFSAEGFPMASPVARLLAGGWINVGRAFAHPEMDAAARTACAAWLEAASLRLDRMLNDRRAALAHETWGRQQPGSF